MLRGFWMLSLWAGVTCGGMLGGSVIGGGQVALGAADYRLETADTLIALEPTAEGLALTRLSRSNDSWNWLQKPAVFIPGVKLVADNKADKKFEPIAWKLKGVEKESIESGARLKARYVSGKPALQLTVTWTAHTGPGPVEQAIEVKNLGEQTVEVGGMPSLAISIDPQPSAKLDYAWVEKGAGKPTPVGTHRVPVGDNFHHRVVSSPWSKRYNSNEMIPWLSLVDSAGGEGLYAIIASSAHVAQQIDGSPGAKGLQITLGLDERVAPMVHELAQGATLKLPLAMIGCFQGSLDDGCNRLHRWVEQWYMPHCQDARFPLLASCTWGRSVNISDPICRKWIDDAATLGFDIFHIDAGWYRDMGWWQPDLKKFPKGMRTISDYAHEKGLLFGLWVAWAQGGATAKGQEALSMFEPSMKNWFTIDVKPDWKPIRAWKGEVVCLGDTAARDWCENELQRIVAEYNLDMLEHDQQVIVLECERKGHNHTSSAVDASLVSAEGYAYVYNELRKKYPKLILENCVDGGSTVDFAIMKICDYVSITDTYDPLSNRQAFFDTSYPLPPRMLECYVGKIDANEMKSLDKFRFTLRSGMLGWCSVIMDPTTWNAEQHEAAKRQFDIYKQELRPLIRDGNLYHISARPSEDGWDATQYIAPDRSKSMIIAFRGQTRDKQYNLKPTGLDAEANYEVTFEDQPDKKQTLTGKELMRRGLKIERAEVNTSDIVRLTKAK